MLSERISRLQELCAERGKNQPSAHFMIDYHSSALGEFAECPLWEKTARAMAFAVSNMDVFAYDGDTIGGRIYHRNDAQPQKHCPDLLYIGSARQRFFELYPEAPELIKNRLISESAVGHITWNFTKILELGTSGFKAEVERALEGARDAEAEEFYRGAIMMLDAMQAFNDKHVAKYEELGNLELAERMKKVPRYPAESFREAVQSFFMQHIVVMRENPFGGNGPGRLDKYLWPYLERDIEKGICTLDEAREIIDELFLRIDERINGRDGWVEAIVVGGTNADGSSAVNPLTYVMVESIMSLDILHPSIYIRLPENPPKELLELAARYMMSGNNRAQILYDPSVIGAMTKQGVPFADAVDYACGGCMEVSVQGKTSDYLYIGWQATPKMLELMVTGGICLRTGEKLTSFHADKGLAAYSDFEEFYKDFIAEADRITKIFLREQDIYSEVAEKHRPSYLISSMIDDCIGRGRNMHAGGAIYHDYGGSQVGLPNVADGLIAIKKAVFDDKFCTAEELVTALKADFKGYERLQAYLRSLPKYGIDNAEADEMARRVMSDFADMYLGYTTRHGGTGKPIILTFIYSPRVAEVTGATPDGRNAGSYVAHGVTPHSGSMTKGITAAINSLGKMPHEKFSGGAASMWDFDSTWVTEEIIESLLRVFIANNGQIFQGNTTSVEELIDAKAHPENYRHLMVRVGGYSARFTNLDSRLQDEIISRVRHNA